MPLVTRNCPLQFYLADIVDLSLLFHSALATYKYHLDLK